MRSSRSATSLLSSRIRRGQRPHRDPGGGGGMVEVVIVGPPDRDGPQQLHPGQGTDLVVFWPALFAAMLNCWLTDEQQWPKNRTHQMFGEWFDLQMCPVVEDLHLDEERPLVRGNKCSSRPWPS